MPATQIPRKTTLALILLLFMLLILASGCANKESSGEFHLEMATREILPDEVQKAPVNVVEAYQFAFANADVLQQLPCYCGCGAMGHTSNYACYISGVAQNGDNIYDPHALGCSICVDITQDAMRLLKKGKSVPDIRAYIDQTYAKYGPSNMP